MANDALEELLLMKREENQLLNSTLVVFSSFCREWKIYERSWHLPNYQRALCVYGGRQASLDSPPSWWLPPSWKLIIGAGDWASRYLLSWVGMEWNAEPLMTSWEPLDLWVVVTFHMACLPALSITSFYTQSHNPSAWPLQVSGRVPSSVLRRVLLAAEVQGRCPA